MKRPYRMLDLFSGLGGASEAARDRGWDVVTVDINPDFGPSHICDVTKFVPDGRFHFVWISPPCDEFARESMPWCRTGKTPSMDLVVAGLNVCGSVNPPLWCLENVRGAAKYISPLVGKPTVTGPFYLWGGLPKSFVVPAIDHFKERLSSSRKAERAKVPYALSLAMILAAERDLEARMR